MKILVRLSVCLLLLVTVGSEARECDWKLTFDGVGPLRIGMTHDEAEAAIGMPLDLIGQTNYEYSLFEPRYCPDSFQVLIWGETKSGVAVIFAGMVSTIDGIRVGDSEERVKKLKQVHPDLFILRNTREAGAAPSKPHQYLRTPIPLILENGIFQNKWKYELNYLTHNGIIVEIRSGLSPDAGYDDIGAKFQ